MTLFIHQIFIFLNLNSLICSCDRDLLDYRQESVQYITVNNFSNLFWTDVIFGQLLTFDEKNIGANIKISGSEDNWSMGIGGGESDNFIVTRNHYTESGIGNGIYGQRINNNGEKLGTNFRVSENGHRGSLSSVAVNY